MVLKNSVVARLNPFVHFIVDIKYIIAFYVLGDFITTYHALNYGLEENPFLAILMNEFGIWSMLMMKILFVGIIYWYYLTLMNEEASWKSQLWFASKSTVSIVGIFLVVNNLLVIFSKYSLSNF